MRWAAFLVLLAFLLGFLVPQAVTVPVIRDGHLMIGQLDVCHSVTPAISTSGDMPLYLHAGACVHVPALLIAHANIPDPMFPQFLFLQQNDRPPNA
jgi:hypothetical protein